MKRILSSIFLFTYILLFYVGLIFGIQTFLPSLFLGLINWALILLSLNFTKVRISLFLIVIYCSLGLISFFVNRNNRVEEVIVAFLYSSFAFNLFINNRKLSFYLFSLLLFLTYTYLLISFINNVDFNQIFIGLSRNYVSVILLVNLFLISLNSTNNRISLFYMFFISVLNSLFSIIAVGRTGIAISLFVSFAPLVYIFLKSNFILKSIILIAFITSSFSIYTSFETEITSLFSRFFDEGLDSLFSFGYRVQIWSSYFDKVTTLNHFIFGPNSFYDVIYNGRNVVVIGNLHNSFLNLYSRYSILFLIFLIIIVFNYIFSFKKTNSSLLFFNKFLIVSILIRSFFDLMFSNWYYDFIFFYIAIIFINKNSSFFVLNNK